MELLVLFLISLATTASLPKVDCPYDQNILALSFEDFDQDMDGGWRAIANKSGCEEKAADIIKLYRINNEQKLSTLYWHEAQLRADINEYSEAISLMEKSLKENDVFAWNPYVRATIAFLQNDKNELNRQRALLENSTPPENWEGEWPFNLNVVDGLILCFGKPYKEAYSQNCRKSN